MANQLASILTGNMLVIRIGNRRIAYAQNLQFQRRMDVSAIYGIGSPSVLALEPVQHGVSWSCQITRYTTSIMKGSTIPGNGATVENATLDRTATANQSTLPDNLKGVSIDNKVDGNSLIEPTFFNPQLLLLAQTFDVDVYEKTFPVNAQGQIVTVEPEGALLFTIQDCRIANYSFNFAPGELLIENISGLARFMTDAQASAV
jgi:hypothetical protein